MAACQAEREPWLGDVFLVDGAEGVKLSAVKKALADAGERRPCSKAISPSLCLILEGHRQGFPAQGCHSLPARGVHGLPGWGV